MFPSNVRPLRAIVMAIPVVALLLASPAAATVLPAAAPASTSTLDVHLEIWTYHTCRTGTYHAEMEATSSGSDRSYPAMYQASVYLDTSASGPHVAEDVAYAPLDAPEARAHESFYYGIGGSPSFVISGSASVTPGIGLYVAGVEQPVGPTLRMGYGHYYSCDSTTDWRFSDRCEVFATWHSTGGWTINDADLAGGCFVRY